MTNDSGVVVLWVEGAQQLSDVLPKCGTSPKLLQGVLQQGRLLSQ